MEWTIFLVALLITKLQQTTGLGTSKISWETRYLNDLASTYNKAAPPVTAQSNQLVVSLDIGILGIDGVDEGKNTFTATFVMVESWTDLRLKFNSSDYGNLTTIIVPSSLVWLPDLVPWNTPPSNAKLSIYGEGVVVSNSGDVYYVPVETVTARCNLDVTNFPRDVQTCTIWLGSWNFRSEKMTFTLGTEKAREKDIKLTMLDVMHPIYDIPEWHLVNNKAKVKVETRSMYFGNWDMISITASLKRRENFYHSLAAGPGAIIGLIIPVLFLLPSESREKRNLGLLIIVGLTLLILLLQSGVPLNNNTIPRIGRYYVCSIVLASMTVVISVILSHLRMREAKTSPVPSWLKSIFLNHGGFRKYLFLGEYTSPDMPYIAGIDHVTKPEAEQNADSKTDTLLNELRMYVRYISGRLMTKETETLSHSDWKEVVRVADRILFLIYFTLYLTSALAFLT